ncbi:transmembrane protein 179-like [Argopecten irradians]|uniref:transmembrane protein 179-like n=1 Tax=Argopecten irradians TaxID=31199 RepID=UPI0037173DE2
MALRQVLQQNFRYVTMFIHFLVIVCCGCAFFPVGSVTNYFQSQCILFSEPVLTLTSNISGVIAKLDIAKSSWGSPNLCNICIYVPVVTAIHSIIWCWFYIQMKTINDDLQVLCSLLISTILQVILFVAQIISSFILSLGFVTFCHHITYQFKDKYTCSETQKWTWDIFERKHKYHTFLTVAVVFSWLVTAILLLQTLLSGYLSYKAVDESYSRHPDDKEFYVNPQKMSYSKLSVDDDTGSFRFNVELSHNSMEEQHDKL